MVTQTAGPLGASRSFCGRWLDDAGLVGGAGGVEEEPEGRAELAGDVAFVGDQEALEDGLVDHPSDFGRRLGVGAVDVSDEAQCPLEVVLDAVEVQFEGVETLLDVSQLLGDLALLFLEEVEWDRSGVVGFEQLGALVERPALPGNELLSFDACGLPEGGDLFEDLLFGLEAQGLGEFDVLVVVGDPLLDALDAERTLAAAGLVALSADTDEVGVDLLAAAGGIADDEPAAALLAVVVQLAAEDRAFEVVVMIALLFSGEVAGLELTLDGLEGLLVDQRRNRVPREKLIRLAGYRRELSKPLAFKLRMAIAQVGQSKGRDQQADRESRMRCRGPLRRAGNPSTRVRQTPSRPSTIVHSPVTTTVTPAGNPLGLSEAPTLGHAG